MGISGVIAAFVLCFNLLIFTAEATSNDNSLRTFTHSEIGRLDPSALQEIVNIYNPLWASVNGIHQAYNNQTEVTEEMLAALAALKKLPVSENVDHAKNVIYRYLSTVSKFQGPVDARAPLIATEVLRELTTSANSSSVEELNEMSKQIGALLALMDPTHHVNKTGRMTEQQRKALLANEQELIRLKAGVIHAALEAEKRKWALPSIVALHQKIVGTAPNVLARNLQMFERLLNEKIIGQPEIVKALVDLEWRARILRGARRNPEIIYLMGLPGTGKDTIVEGWVQALNPLDPDALINHLYRLPVVKDRDGGWKVLGSTTGYIGSETTPPILEFLVNHSGGKYKFEQVPGNRGPVFRIIHNPAYKGEVLPNYFSPDQGVIFVNEFHNWSKVLKDELLKQAIEHGRFTINNPNGGLTEIEVPVRFAFASNEGINLISARDGSGNRFGKTMTFEQLTERWEAVHQDKDALKAELLASNIITNEADRGSGRGISEEFANRIPNNRLFLTRPLAPRDLRKIARDDVERRIAMIKEKSTMLGDGQIVVADSLIELVQSLDYNAEDNARPIQARVTDFFETTLIDLYRTNPEIVKQFSQGKLIIGGRIEPDGTASMTLEIMDPAKGVVKSWVRPIRATEKFRNPEPMKDEEITEVIEISGALKKEVFGIDAIIDEIERRLLVIENQRRSGKTAQKASVIGAFGLTSTGKTQLGKSLANHLNKDKGSLITFDMSQIQTLRQFQENFLGFKDYSGQPVPSKFMNHYDRNGGKMIIAIDEIANVQDPDLLKMLYDLFREPVVSTFSDGKPRDMSQVFFVVTGNALQELFLAVPGDLPMDVQMMAWQEIYRSVKANPAQMRLVLEKYIPGPLLTRLGANNIFLFPPHSFRSLRQLAQLKTMTALNTIKASPGKRGWNIAFASPQDFSQLMDTIVDAGFNLRDQGASIDAYVNEELKDQIEQILLKENQPTESTFVLKFREVYTPPEHSDERKVARYDLIRSDGLVRIPLQLRYRAEPTEATRPKILQQLTAFHEAGHSVVRQAILGHAYKPGKVSIIPGVTRIGGEYVYYAGVAETYVEADLYQNRDWVVREIAVLAAGETAERLVSVGEIHGTGKSNDMKRASKLAQDAILRYGLSEAWGTRSVPAEMTTEQYILSLTEDSRRLFEQEKQKLLNEGRRLAELSLQKNWQVFLDLGVQLAEHGELDRQKMESFYAGVKLNSVASKELKAGLLARASDWFAKVKRHLLHQAPPLIPELKPGIPHPKAIADIAKIAEQKKRLQYDSVELPENLPIVQLPLAELNSCEALLTSR